MIGSTVGLGSWAFGGMGETLIGVSEGVFEERLGDLGSEVGVVLGVGLSDL